MNLKIKKLKFAKVGVGTHYHVQAICCLNHCTTRDDVIVARDDVIGAQMWLCCRYPARLRKNPGPAT